jgi:hypothetical protein
MITNNMSIEKFNTIIARKKEIPYYVQLSCDPMKYASLYKFSPIITSRAIMHGVTPTIKKHIRIDPIDQYQCVTAIVQSKNCPYTICISSEPNDILALEVTGVIQYFLMLNNPGISWMWRNSWKYLKDTESNDKDVLFLYNITVDTPINRLQQIRDVLTYYNKSLKIVIISGMDPVTFFDRKLHMPLSGCCYITGKGKPINPYIKYNGLDGMLFGEEDAI